MNGGPKADAIGLKVRSGFVQYGIKNGTLTVFGTKAVKRRLPSRGNGGDDQIDCSGLTDPTYIDGGAGNDKINGSQGVDSILGQDGADTINGYASADKIDGGTGKNTIIPDVLDTVAPPIV